MTSNGERQRLKGPQGRNRGAVVDAARNNSSGDADETDRTRSTGHAPRPDSLSVAGYGTAATSAAVGQAGKPSRRQGDCDGCCSGNTSSGTSDDVEGNKLHQGGAAGDFVGEDAAAGIHNPLLYLATDEIAAFNPHDHPHAVAQSKLDLEARQDSLGGGCGGIGSAFECTFRGRSPKFVRFGILILITLVPFGAHFIKSCFSSLETYFLQDPSLRFTVTKYGAVMSAKSIPNLFMPFFGGLFLDSRGHNNGILLFLGIELVGHVVFTVAMGFGNFWLAIAGEVLHGLGSGTVMVAMRAVVSKYFLDNELTFALGVTIAGACVSKTLAKASVAPIAETEWGYMGALWYAGLWQLLSLLAGVFYVRLANSARRNVETQYEGGDHKDVHFRKLLAAMQHSTLSFWLVALLHTLFLTAYHLFSNYSGHFLYENYEVSPVLAGYISSLMPLVVVFFAPIAGLILDKYGRQLYVLLICNVVTTGAYVLLQQRQAGAVFCIVLLAFCESFVPTILLSALPLTVDSSVYGAAFGLAEVLTAVSNIFSNVFFGYSRDATESYEQDLKALVVLCIVCALVTLFLLVWDARRGEHKLNGPGRACEEEVLPLKSSAP